MLRPDPATNNACLYCLIGAAVRCEIDIVLPCAMSNHYHAVIYDRAGRYPQFIEHSHKMLARSQNARRRRGENFWSSEQTSVARLADRDAVMEKLTYAAANSVLGTAPKGSAERRGAKLCSRRPRRPGMLRSGTHDHARRSQPHGSVRSHRAVR